MPMVKWKSKWAQDDETGIFVADYLLAAIGRTPNVDNLGLENIKIDTDKRGVPIANPETMQTSIPHIFYRGAMHRINCLCYTKLPTKVKLQAKTLVNSPISAKDYAVA